MVELVKLEKLELTALLKAFHRNKLSKNLASQQQALAQPPTQALVSATRPSAALFFSRSEAFYVSIWLYLFSLLWFGMVVFPQTLKNRFSEST